MAMEMNSRDVRGVAVVDLVGRLTSSDSAGALGARVARLMAEGHTQVVLNLAKLSYMDSSGLGEMVSCYSHVRKAGGSIRLAQTTARIQDSAYADAAAHSLRVLRDRGFGARQLRAAGDSLNRVGRQYVAPLRHRSGADSPRPDLRETTPHLEPRIVGQELEGAQSQLRRATAQVTERLRNHANGQSPVGLQHLT